MVIGIQIGLQEYPSKKKINGIINFMLQSPIRPQMNCVEKQIFDEILFGKLKFIIKNCV
jgi:hypothetical protein